MSSRRGKFVRKQKKGKKKRSRDGTITHSPLITMGTQAPMYRAFKVKNYTRVFKYESLINTIGGQAFAQTSYYIYSPYAKATVSAGSITVNGGPGASLTDLYGIFALFRVRKIAFTFSSVNSTSIALPSIYCALMPETSPNNIGVVANTSLVASFANSFVIDPHYSCSFSYKIPSPSSVSYIGANTIDGGWLPSAGQSIPVSTNPGIIAFSCGDTLFAPPLTTTLGTLVVEYVMDFKSAE